MTTRPSRSTSRPVRPQGGGTVPDAFASFVAAGAGGTLSNGTIEIGGVDWTLYGISGSSTHVGLYASLSDVMDSFDPDRPVEAVACVSAYTSASTQTGIMLARQNAARTRFDSAFLYRDGASRWRSARANYNTGAILLQTGGTMLEAGGRAGLVSSRGASTATFSNTIDTDPARPLSFASESFQTVAQRVGTLANTFGADDVIDIGLLRYSGAALAGSVVQSASGLLISLGGASIQLTDLHIGNHA